MAGAETIESGDANDFTARNRIFWIKSRLFILRRLLAGFFDHQRPLGRLSLSAAAIRLAVDEHPLYSVTNPRERDLEMGKVQNLRVAAAAIDGIVLEPGDIFSFWREVGRPSRGRGYVLGREFRLGCLIPSVGGGICQLTNALSRVAHLTGMEIIERHSHSIHPNDFFIDDQTDATVFWNYVDLRFRSRKRVRLGATLTESTLIVRLDSIA